MKTLIKNGTLNDHLSTNPFDTLWTRSIEEFSDLSGISFSTNVRETQDKYILEVAVPGFNKKELEISIRDNRLAIHGNKKLSKGRWLGFNREFNSQNIYRSFNLPKNIDQENIHATCRDGILTISLKKLVTVKTIKVKGSSVGSATRVLNKPNVWWNWITGPLSNFKWLKSK